MITVNNLSYRYPKAKENTLLNLSFTIEKGEIFGFLGPSGAGKSTTQKILYRILQDYEGEITIEGKSLKEIDNAYFKRIGVGFELPNHYSKLTGEENINFFSSFYNKDEIADIDELFALVGLSDAKKKKVEEYSKGMQMRLNYIRALINNPDILFFDEPTAGLDPVNARKIKDHIKQLKKEGKTIFITTHNMNTADELCDRVAFIVNGKLEITDQPGKLKNKHGKDAVLVELKNGKKQEFSMKDLALNKTFINFLQEDELLRINSEEATLEQVFIEVTGTNLNAQNE